MSHTEEFCLLPLLSTHKFWFTWVNNLGLFRTKCTSVSEAAQRLFQDDTCFNSDFGGCYIIAQLSEEEVHRLVVPPAGREADVVPYEMLHETDAGSLHLRGGLGRILELGTRVVGIVMFEGAVGEPTNAASVDLFRREVVFWAQAS